MLVPLGAQEDEAISISCWPVRAQRHVGLRLDNVRWSQQLENSSSPWWANQLIVPLLVSIIVSLTTSALAYQFEKRSHARQLNEEYVHGQLAEFRERVTLQKAAYLEAAELLSDRISNFYRNGERGWLAIDYSQRNYGYYMYSFAYRILSLLCVCYQIERDANFARIVAASEKDHGLRVAAKLQIAVWTRASLFDGLSYDDENAKDHFYRDSLGDVACLLGEISSRTPVSAFRALAPNDEHAYREMFDFLDNLTPNEHDRYRFDRLVAVHLVTLATMTRFGDALQRSNYDELCRIAERCQRATVLEQVSKLVVSLGVHDEIGYSDLMRALRDVTRDRDQE
ncbi:hypothetical protein [Streptomyces sp. NBC_00035]|uniref:hypothetical protein n=1 Tax=Streptomyces sp. NBC_00035 TaxID=2903614 RepID=UPI00325049A3